MKTSIDIPDADLSELMGNTEAKTRTEAILLAIRKFNKRKRLEKLNERLHGKFKDFMTQEDLKVMREDAKWESMK
jgi:hypothetical protein